LAPSDPSIPTTIFCCAIARRSSLAGRRTRVEGPQRSVALSLLAATDARDIWDLGLCRVER
jgi:hypothetical protein